MLGMGQARETVVEGEVTEVSRVRSCSAVDLTKTWVFILSEVESMCEYTEVGVIEKLFIIYCVPGTGDTAVNQTKIPALVELILDNKEGTEVKYSWPDDDTFLK